LGIPVIGILDSNCDPDELAYPIPGNDDAIRSVGLLTRIIADAVAEGLIERHQKPESGEAAEPMAEWERELLEAGGAAAPATEVAAEATAEVVAEAEVVATEAPAETMDNESPATDAAEPAAEKE